MIKKQAFLNARIWDAKAKTTDMQNMVLAGGKLVGFGYVPDDDNPETETVELSGKYVIPNVVDAYVGLRDPGFTELDSLSTVTQAAKNGGSSCVITTPSTSPCMDTPEMIQFLNFKSQTEACLPIRPMGALTKGREGKVLAELGLLVQAGVCALTDDGPVDDPIIMKMALQYSQHLNVPIVVSPMDTRLSDSGVMHDGYYSSVLGLKGSSQVAEVARIARDIELVRQYGGRLHVFPVTTAQSVALVRKAKADGLSVTCGTTPYYLLLHDEHVQQHGALARVSPPLRTVADSQALAVGIANGTVDVLASSHHPCTLDDKRSDFVSAKPGISGADLFVALVLHAAHGVHQLPLPVVLPTITSNPARIFGLKLPSFGLTQKASFAVVDLKAQHTVTVDDFKSRGKNSPFIGTALSAWVTQIVG